jgi:hypothetical protein
MRQIALILTQSFVCLSLAACVSASTPDGPSFQRIEPPQPGLARLYVFRPSFSKLLGGDQPILSIDGEQKAFLANDRYIAFELKPGLYTISLSPRRFDSSLWHQERGLEVHANGSYFMAIWNTSEPKHGLTLFPVAGVLLPLPSVSAKANGVYMELISEEQAATALDGMHAAEPIKAGGGAKP